MSDSIPTAIHWIGGAGAVLTKICWLPQAVRVVRTRETHEISLATNLTFAAGILLLLIYGVALGNWPLIAANVISMMFTLVIIPMKMLHGKLAIGLLPLGFRAQTVPAQAILAAHRHRQFGGFRSAPAFARQIAGKRRFATWTIQSACSGFF